MLYLSFLLHIYQPPTQDLEVTKKITRDSYSLILSILEKTKGKITLNIPASLSLQLVKNNDSEIIRRIQILSDEGLVELTNTAAFHPLLPRLSAEEIKRQIGINTEINTKIFGIKTYRPVGFFPPEMAYSSRVGNVLEELGFEYVVLDEFSYPKHCGLISHDYIYIKRNKKDIKNIIDQSNNNYYNDLKLYFRSDELSNAVAMSGIKNLSQFESKIKAYNFKGKNYLIIAIDGETFGHHQVGQDKLLSDILLSSKYQIVTLSEIGKYFRIKKQIVPSVSSWGSTENDLRKKIYWTNWSYPGNRIQKLQWQLYRLALKGYAKNTKDLRGREILNRALHSDQFWWSSKKPYWHPAMIMAGADLLLEAIKLNSSVSKRIKTRAKKIYQKICLEVS